MGNPSYEQGVKHGRDGEDPHVPSRGFVETIMGVSKDDVKDMAQDYKAGYAAGSSQRAADSKDD